jgi:hypothetical protein
MPLTTIEKVENYALIEIEESYEPTVQTFINAVTAYIERYTGRVFADPEEDIEATDLIYDGTNGDEIFIDDAIEVTGVNIGDDELDITDFVVYPSNRLPKTRIILPYRIFTTGNQNVTVTAKWGYGSVPADISLAATVMVAGIINGQNSQDTDNREVQSETIGRYSVTYKSGSQQATDYLNAKETLKMYKRYA